MFASDRDKQNVLASARWIWDQVVVIPSLDGTIGVKNG